MLEPTVYALDAALGKFYKGNEPPLLRFYLGTFFGFFVQLVLADRKSFVSSFGILHVITSKETLYGKKQLCLFGKRFFLCDLKAFFVK